METNEGADAAAPNIRVLKAVVIGLGLLIVVGVVALIVGLFWRASKMGEPAGAKVAPPTALTGPAALTAPAALTGPVALPRGAVLTDMAATGDRVVLRLRLADGTTRLVFVDPRAAAVAGQLDLKAE